jgi:hypothetical protein
MTNEAKGKRDAPLSLRLSREERARLERAAGSVPLGTYIKSRLFGEGVAAPRTHARNPKIEQRMLAQLLARLGASPAATALRELADAARSGSFHFDDEAKALIERACADVIAMRDMLMRALGLKIDEAGQDDLDLPAAFNAASESPES